MSVSMKVGFYGIVPMHTLASKPQVNRDIVAPFVIAEQVGSVDRKSRLIDARTWIHHPQLAGKGRLLDAFVAFMAICGRQRPAKARKERAVIEANPLAIRTFRIDPAFPEV